MRLKTINSLIVPPKTYNSNTRTIYRRVKAKNPSPVKVSLFYFDKVLNKIRKNNKTKTKKQQHPLVEDYGFAGNTSLSLCLQSSLNEIIRDTSPKPNYCHTGSYLLNKIHKAILHHNWTHCLDLLKELLTYSGLNSRYLMYIFRVIFILLFNLRVSPDQLDLFLSVALGMKDEKLKSNFLKSLFELPEELKFGSRIEARKLREARQKSRNLASEENPTNRVLRSSLVRDGMKKAEQIESDGDVDDPEVTESH